MQRSHKIRLSPNNKQRTYFAKACGIRRLAFNWGLAEWEAQYESGDKPTSYGLKKKFNAIKKEQYPFVYEVTKCSPERAFTDLDTSFKRFFKKQSKYPTFKKKGVNDSFYISSDKFTVDGDSAKVPKLGWVKMTEPLRYSGKIMSATISRKADWWFISIAVKIDEAENKSENQTFNPVGIDFGVSKLATLSDGTVFDSPRVTKKFSQRLRLLNKSLSRKVKGSNNWKKDKLRLQRLHVRIGDYRADAVHKFSTYIADNYSDVCLEDLNVSGMVKNHKLAKAIQDVSFYEAKRQLSYKCETIHEIYRWFPSTKMCGDCGIIHDMKLSDRVLKCDCGFEIDRDLNAAQNILRQGLPSKFVERQALVLQPSLVYETGLWEARS